MSYRLAVIDSTTNQELNIRLGSASDMRFDGSYAMAMEHAEEVILGLSRHTRSQIPKNAVVKIVYVEPEKPSMTYDEFVAFIVNAVKVQCKTHRVCLNGIKEYYDRNDLAGAIENSVDETLYWNS